MKHRKFYLIDGVIILTLILTGCTAYQNAASPSPSTNATAPAATNPGPAEQNTNAVSIQNFSFSPAELTISPGTTVIWTNLDSVTHTVTSDTGAFDSGGITMSETFSWKFDAAGTYEYHCTPHPFMKGKIIVQ